VDDYQATWILDKLKDRGYAGGYDTVKRFVRTIKAQKSRLAYVRFETEPGKQAQFDWGDFQVEEPGGRTSRVFVFMLVLGFSRTDYVEFMDRCTLETLLDGHIRGFKYLGGVPAEILYDNMKHVVVGRDAAGKPIFNPECLHFAHHYGFQPKACAPYSPWNEGQGGAADRLPAGALLAGLYVQLPAASQPRRPRLVERDGQRRVHGTHHQSIEERWAQERPHLGPLPAFDYDTSLKTFRKVYRDCQVSFNANRYVVPHRAVGQTVLLKVKNGQIRIFLDQDLLATYTEPAGKHVLMAHPQFYEDLRKDREQLRRKYGRSKGKATRGLSHGSLLIDVDHRSLEEYEEARAGRVSWSN